MFRNFFVIIMVLALTGCTKGEAVSQNTGIVGENQPITRAEVARMVALNSYSIEEINGMERKITFSDTDISKWYDKYINAAFSANIIAGTDSEHFAPDEYLSLRQAQFLLDKLKTDNKVKLQYEQEDKDKPIPYNIWVAAFEKDINTEKLKSCELKIFGDKKQCKRLGNNFIVTDLGLTFYEGYEVLAADEIISAIVNRDTIVAIKSINKVEEYENMEIVEKGEGFIKVKVPGGTRKFQVNESSGEVGDLVNIIVEGDGMYKIK